jgi:hypothetical protein
MALYRTHCSNLTDDELILLDILFDVRCSIAFLRREVFREQFNCDSHNLDGSQLESAVERLIGEGILETSDHRSNETRSLQITPKGGRIWSEERAAIWELYGYETSKTLPNHREMVTFIGVSAECRDSFLDLWPRANAKHRAWVIEEYELIYWRRFHPVYVGVAIYDNPTEWEIDEYFEYVKQEEKRRQKMEQERRFWRFVKELQKFVANKQS